MKRIQCIGLGLLAATCAAALALPASATPGPPPKSDGSSGSFDALFGNGEYLQWFNPDNGQAIAYVGGGDSVAFTVPHKTITWNGQTLNAYEFSDFYVEPSVSLMFIGTQPAVFLAQGNMTIAGQFRFQNGAIVGGTPSTGSNGNYDGGAGQGIGGGGGGEGPGGGSQACVSVEFTGSGGGGGGNFRAGGHGLKNYFPQDATDPVPPTYPGGFGGKGEHPNVLQGGGGGGAPGGGNANGEYWAGPAGGNGGGAVVFSTSGTITLTNTAVLDASGAAGQTNDAEGNPGYSGGGAGGDVWFYASSLSNAGQIRLNGGPGGAAKAPLTACGSQRLVNGPNGGNGSGGILLIKAPSIANSGTINLSGGNGTATPNGGLLNANGVTIQNTGTITGVNKTE